MKAAFWNLLQNNIHPFLILFCFLRSSVISGANEWGPHFLTFSLLLFLYHFCRVNVECLSRLLAQHTPGHQKYEHQSNVFSLYWIQFLSKETGKSNCEYHSLLDMLLVKLARSKKSKLTLEQAVEATASQANSKGGAKGEN